MFIKHGDTSPITILEEENIDDISTKEAIQKLKQHTNMLEIENTQIIDPLTESN